MREELLTGLSSVSDPSVDLFLFMRSPRASYLEMRCGRLVISLNSIIVSALPNKSNSIFCAALFTNLFVALSIDFLLDI